MLELSRVILGATGQDEWFAPACPVLRTAKGVVFEDAVAEAPKFMRYVPLLDPDGNRLYIAQYSFDPFSAA